MMQGDHNQLSGRLAHKNGAAAESLAWGCTICNITVGEYFTHIAVCKQGAVIDTACLELGINCIQIDEASRVCMLSEGAETFLDAVAKKIKVGDYITCEQVQLLGELISETILNVVVRKRPPQVSRRLLCTEPLTDFHAIDIFWLSVDEGAQSSERTVNLKSAISNGLAAGITTRKLQHRLLT